MGARISCLIEEAEVENDYSSGSHIYNSVRIEFNSVSDILFIKQADAEIVMEIGQVNEFIEIIRDLGLKLK